jgi:hypothetical protein
MAGTDRVPPLFKLVFLTVVALTLVMLVISLSLSIRYPHPNSNINGAISTTSTLYKLGFGAIVGLIGGKAST